MSRRSITALLAALAIGAVTTACSRPQPSPKTVSKSKYAALNTCAACHPAIAASYRQTGMARSFTGFDPARTRAAFSTRNQLHHAPSDRHYTMTLRDGAAYMKRYQLDPGGREINAVEKRIDYIMGSGLKAQTMIHRTPRGELVEMPVAWYTNAAGGYWAMNPSYDRPDHPDFRRRIRYDCFFCHNAYPTGIADDSFAADAIYPAALPSGIDCQRCHGPGAEHVAASSAKQPVEKIRAAIVNPKRLTRAAQLDICYQCHLQSTSSALPHMVTRLDRGVFSYRAGEPLEDYALHFDHPPEAGRADKFEIAHAAYRLRQSACFAASQMTCTTCHDPHRAALAGSAACRQCHAQVNAAPAEHNRARECVSCHMPQRRTDDVVRVTMTDHRITRRAPPAQERLAPRQERHRAPYRGPVVPYYPAQPGALHLAIAQVRVGANLTAGIEALAKAVTEAGPACGSPCYFELADAYGKARRFNEAAAAAETALRGDPDNPWLLRAYGSLLSARGELSRGAELLERCRSRLGDDPGTLHALALNYQRQGRPQQAEPLLRAAIAADPGAPHLHTALGELLFAQGGRAGAADAFAAAIRAEPGYAVAHLQLAILDLNAPEAEHHLKQAARFAANDGRVRHTYGVWLASRRRLPEAAIHLEAAIANDAARMDSLLALGMVLAELGQHSRAAVFLRRAASATDPGIRAQANDILRMLNATPAPFNR